jgi:release factor glutamine methyltransferase
LFNPPYVPSGDEEVGHDNIQAAWAGGVDGREIIDLLIPIVHKLLSPNGLFYLVTIEENNPKQLCTKFHHLKGKLILKRVRGDEILYILCFKNDKK